jgi:arginase
LQKLGWTTQLCPIKFTAPSSDPQFQKVKNPRGVGQICQQVASYVKEALEQKQIALTLGGDHSLGVGTVAGTSQVYGQDYCVLWVDAHADINTAETTESGNMHGMPVSFLLNLPGNEAVPGMEWLQKKPSALRSDRIAFIGLRDVDDGEKKLLKDNNITAFSMYDVDKYGIYNVIQMALDRVNPRRDLPIHLSFDVDALDPSVAPATGTPVRGGLTFREGHFICEEIWKTGLLVALDIMEVNPTLGDAVQKDQTVKIGCSLSRVKRYVTSRRKYEGARWPKGSNELLNIKIIKTPMFAVETPSMLINCLKSS